MNRKVLLTYVVSALFVFLCPSVMDAQNKQNSRKKDSFLEYFVDGKDTIYVDQIRASKVYPKLARHKGKEWRKYYRLVHNFSKTYPYALAAKQILSEADSTISTDHLKRRKKDKYISSVQKELFSVFEKPLKNLTISQGALLMKLIDRETGLAPYYIIKDYKNGAAAGFWQGVGKIFKYDMKKGYDPKGEDANIEELVQIWQEGDYEAFYFSIFWQDMPKVSIPEEYRQFISESYFR